MMNRQFWRSATPEDVRKLIAQGADINAAFESSMTCDADTYRMLDFALRFGNKEMVEALLSASPDISYESRLGITPLIAAAALHDMDILILLWEAGAKDTVNQATNNAYTAMDLANDKTKDFLTLHSGKSVYKTAPVTVHGASTYVSNCFYSLKISQYTSISKQLMK